MNRILIVEDEKMIRYGIYVMVENSGIPYEELKECRNGKEAVELLAQQRFDLVLTDIKMPVMDGIGLSEWIQNNLEQDERPLLVAISGYTDFEYAKGMLKANALDYILKPVDREELSKVLWRAQNIIREKRGDDSGGESDGKKELTFVNRKKMQEAEDYIRKNFRRPVDMVEVSNYVSMNYTMFSSEFKKYAGCNFSTFLKRLRIEKAKKLLCGTDMKMNEICMEVGFEDARRFAKVFKEETGMIPRLYRESVRD